MRLLLIVITMLVWTGCSDHPRGVALCQRAPRYAALEVSTRAVYSVCVDSSAMADFSGQFLVAQAVGDAGLHHAADTACDWQLVITTTPPAALQEGAAAVWNAGANSPERFAVISVLGAGRAVSTIHAGNSRAAVYGVRAAVAALAVSTEPQRKLFQTGTLVDYPAFVVRGVVESIYGKVFSESERQKTLELMSCLGENIYVYGQKDADLYTHYRWADPYPEKEARAIQTAAQLARERLISFVWAVSPGWWGGDEFIADSICYSCDADFDRLKRKTAAMRALGVTRFALLLDDLHPALPWPADQKRFSSPAQAHAFLINRWNDYLMTTGANEQLLVVGLKYTSDETNILSGQDWRTYNQILAASLHAKVQLLWTGPRVFSPSISAFDLTAINQLHGQKVVVWDNWPKTVVALTGRSPDLTHEARGLLSCPVINEYNEHPVENFWPILGTAADYAWRPETYVPASSFARWQKAVPFIVR